MQVGPRGGQWLLWETSAFSVKISNECDRTHVSVSNDALVPAGVHTRCQKLILHQKCDSCKFCRSFLLVCLRECGLKAACARWRWGVVSVPSLQSEHDRKVDLEETIRSIVRTWPSVFLRAGLFVLVSLTVLQAGNSHGCSRRRSLRGLCLCGPRATGPYLGRG